MTKWSELLNKTSISPDIFEDLEELDAEDRARIEALRDLCAGVIDSKEKVKQLREAIAALRKQRRVTPGERGYFADVKEELAEIAEDIRFASTKRGQFVLSGQDWWQHLHPQIRADERFDDIVCGMHADKYVYLVIGKVRGASALAELQQLIDAHEPPVPVEYRVEVR